MIKFVTGVPAMLAKMKALSVGKNVIVKAGLIKAGLLIEREAKKNCPVDLGNLKASGYTVAYNKPLPSVSVKDDPSGKITRAVKKSMTHSKIEVAEDKGFTVIVGFGANYALYVHELHASKGKFLEKAVRENRDRILKIVSGK